MWAKLKKKVEKIWMWPISLKNLLGHERGILKNGRIDLIHGGLKFFVC